MSSLFEVENLQTRFKTGSGYVGAVNDISYSLNENEIVGFVGESGCGKTVSQLSVMQLISHPGQIVGGKVLFEGRNLFEFQAKSREMCAIRGSKIAMIFQEPTGSLNPVLTIGYQVAEMLETHLGMSRKKAKDRAIELLNSVKIPDAGDRYGNYPYQFSGGMLQRVMIAIAMSCNPRILIADEPTSALDVTTQAQVLDLMKELVARYRTSMLLVTHNLGIVARYARRLYVMYAGQIVESGTTKEVFENPCHPYTRGLLRCVPGTDGYKSSFVAIKGCPPDLRSLPDTCAFLPRCDCRMDMCFQEPVPTLVQVKDQHYVRCYGAI